MSPAPNRVWPLFAPWNWQGIRAFAVAFADARKRELENGDWDLTMESWLQGLNLSRQQQEGMILPWAASLYSGNIEQARGLSARAAMIFAAKALPENVTAPFLYYILNPGMTEVLRRMVARFTTVQVQTQTRAIALTRVPEGGFDIHSSSGQPIRVDNLIFASPAPDTLALLRNLPGTSLQQAAMQDIQFHDARLALHTDPIYAQPHVEWRSFFNAQIQGGFCEASMWLADVLVTAMPGTTMNLWKSWITHRMQHPSRILAAARFRHMLPTPATLHAQNALQQLQGQGGIWFVGGYTRPYDSQETALVSAIDVAQRLLALPH